MPKAAIHEDRDVKLGEYKIRFPENGTMSPPARDAIRPEEFCQCPFRIPIALPSNTRHYLGALGLCEDVRHQVLGVA